MFSAPPEGRVPWRSLWTMALVVMTLTVCGALIDGCPLGMALKLGVVAGPGWLICLTVVGIIWGSLANGTPRIINRVISRRGVRDEE